MLPGPIIDSTLDTSVVTVSRPLADLLVSTTTTEVYASARTIPLSEQGVNLVGTFSPNPQAPGNLNEYIALGFGYDNPDFGLELMNRLTQLDKSRRSFLFLFTDSPQGVTHFSDHLPVSAHRIKVFLDLRNLGDGGNFVYSTKQAPITRQFAWSLGTTLTKAFTDRGMTPDQIETTRVGAEYRLIADPGVNAMFWNAGVATIHIGGEVEDLEGLGDILLKALYTNNY